MMHREPSTTRVAPTRTSAKGWCPGAYRPMVSGDGWLVRVRPRLARLSALQATGLCQVARRFGSGVIDLTSRANLQLRGVQARDHGAVIDALCGLGLLDADPALEAWPAILVAPMWQAGDDTECIVTELMARRAGLPALPPKFGFAVDAGPAPVLGDASADVRIERGRSGALIVRADGAEAGHPVSRSGAADAALAMATWFARTAASHEPAARRMAAHLAHLALPAALAPREAPALPAPLPAPGRSSIGPVYGAAFGQIDASALTRLLHDTHAAALRLAPNRVLILEGGDWCDATDFITTADDPLRRVDACPGAPSCSSATVDTRALARALARSLALATTTTTPRSVHVSGCTKGCARARAAEITLVGRDGAFDLVRHGRAWDAPTHTALSPDVSPGDLLSLLGAPDAQL